MVVSLPDICIHDVDLRFFSRELSGRIRTATYMASVEESLDMIGCSYNLIVVNVVAICIIYLMLDRS